MSATHFSGDAQPHENAKMRVFHSRSESQSGVETEPERCWDREYSGLCLLIE